AAGLRPILMPARPWHRAARLAARVPGLPSYAEWVEAFATPAVMDTGRAKRELGWEPRWTGLDAWRDTLR
ncbi:MAG: Nucleoside-diphosphate-sugar epimerase, partial [Frankiales bacterium]|nr:Nucleoside-diphosphate-sugar epimerase [Frankiales bacterium]